MTYKVRLEFDVPAESEAEAEQILLTIIKTGCEARPSFWYEFGVKFALIMFGATAMAYLMVYA